MDSKERVYATIKKEAVERIPWGEIVIEDDVVVSYLQRERVGVEEKIEFVLSLNMDIISIQPKYPSLSGKERLPSLKEVSLGDMDIWANKTSLFIFVVLDGAFEWGIRVFGFKEFMMLIARGTPRILDFTKAVIDLNRGLASMAYDMGASGVLLADDIAYGRGLMISPYLFRKTILPSLSEQVEIFNNLGFPVFFHSDGNLMEIMDDIASTGISGLQSLEPKSGMDLKTVKDKYGDTLCLWGNLDPDYLTSPHTFGEIEREVKAIIDISPHGRGLIFGTCSGLYRGIRADNLKMVHSVINTYPRRSL
ncbi:MAG: uroporphyrinogen decarboxylase family protein [Syntrophorhabdaceae bacterium]|nr:uroporphyrinogen decarboxylase family protein [Syntrophorhabdaceae bacterium]